jgi:Ulp1 family protease
METLFIPLHINNNHWASIIIHFPNQTITYLDLMRGNSHPHVDRILHFLQPEHQAFHHSPLPDWEFIHTPTPLQENSKDCGIYTCFFANRILLKAQKILLLTSFLKYNDAADIAILPQCNKDVKQCHK